MRKTLHFKNLRTFLGLAFLFMLSMNGWGQTNPVAFDLSTGSFTFTSQSAVSTSYPTNMQGWTTGSGNITAITTAAPGANQSLVASGSASTSGLSNLGVNGFNFLSTSSAPNTQVGEIAVAINTSGRINILVSWTAADNLATASRVSALALQYRVGTSGAFTTVAGTTYTTTAAAQAAAQNFSNIALPSSCNNQSIVQVRWIYWEVSGAGGRDPIRLDDITISSSPVATPPTLTAASATVDADFNITYTDDAAWRGAVTAVKYGAVTLTPGADYSLAAGILTLKTTGPNAALHAAGTQTVTVIATGYADATVSQAINAGAPTANSTATINASLALNTTRTITCTAKDQYNNLVSGYTFKYDATITSNDGTTAESYTIDGASQIATVNDVNMVATTNGSGVATFTTTLPATVDNNDGISIQVQLNNGTTNIGSAFTYYELPAQTISFGSLSNVTYGDAPFTVSATGGGSGNPVTFTSSNPAIATCSGTDGATVTIIAPGTCSIYANQAGNGGFNAASQVAQSLTVNVKTLTILTPAANNKVYNGTTAATLTGTLSAVVGADVVTLTLSGTFPSANVGTAIAVTSTSVLGGANASKYILAQPAGLTANITAKPLTISGKTATSKVYDGTTTNTLSGTAALVGVIAADIANVILDITTVTSNFADNLVGTTKPVTVTGYSILGTASGNYSLSQPTGLTANITAKPLTITGLSANNKVQDGTTSATLSGTATLNGVETIDLGNVNITGSPTATFASSGVGTGIAVTVSGYSLSGTAAANYSVSQPGFTANITGLAAPVATAATSILQTQFNANWNTVTDANNGYLLDVSTSATFGTTGSATLTENFTTYTGATSFNGWSFGSTISNYTTAASAGPSGANSVKFLNSGTSGIATSPVLSGAASQLSFYLISNASSGSSFLIEGYNGSSWVTIQTLTTFVSTPGQQYIYNSGTTPALPSNITQFRFTYTKSSGNIAFDDVSINYNTSAPSFVAGYNAKPVAGQASITSIVNTLAENTTYYYRLRALNGTAQSANSNVITVTTKPTACTWNGSVWSNSTGPDADIEAVIAGVYSTTANGVFIAKKITVNSGSLTINSGTNLTVQNELINNLTAADVVVENNANIIQVNDIANTGGVMVKRNSASLMRQDYTLWASPVNGQQLQAFSPATLATRFYTYNPSTNLYVTETATNNFVTGKAYLIRMPNTHPATPTIWNGTFTGTPNNGAVNVTVTNGTYNAIGNPYPSTINADTFINDNGITEALYFWRKTNNAATTSYATYTLAGGAGTGSNSGDPLGLVPNGIIQVGQGFIAKSTNTTLLFNNTMRVANNTNQFLKSADDKSRIWVNLTNTSGLFSQMMVAYMPTATTGIDAAIDGRFFNDSQTALTSIINSEQFTVQGRPTFDVSDVVALGFKSELAGSYAIAIDHFDGLFTGNQDIFLKDNLMNTIHDLKAGPYNFATAAGVFNSRFEIVYQNSLLDINLPDFTENSVVVYKNNGGIQINTGSIIMDNVKIFDIRGRLLLEKSKMNTTETTIDSSRFGSQVLIVQITSDAQIKVSKKVVN